MAINTTLESTDEMSDIIKRPQIKETKSRKLEDPVKQKEFKKLCKVHSIVSSLGHRINDAIDLI